MRASAGNSIAVLICWYGPFPWYFQYFLHSCKHNPNVNFIIITDNEEPEDVPDNVQFIRKTLMQIQKEASERFGFEVKIDEPYKLCDFKPAYGFLFPELISKFTFWGHGDIDVLFGRIRNFITDDILSVHDLVCVRHDFLTGYFLIFRNCKKMNELFMHSKDYKKVFTESRHFCFDETNFAFERFSEGVHYEKIITEVESMTHVVKRLHSSGFLNAYFDFHVIEGVPGKIKWRNGELFFKNQYEALLYHFIRFKEVYKPKGLKKMLPESFSISPTKIYSRSIFKNKAE